MAVCIHLGPYSETFHLGEISFFAFRRALIGSLSKTGKEAAPPSSSSVRHFDVTMSVRARDMY